MSTIQMINTEWTNPPSGCVAVFPVAKNRVINGRQQRLLYEDNIANLIRQVTDRKAFVLEVGSNPVELDIRADKTSIKLNDIRFNLYGYYFDISAQLADADPFSIEIGNLGEPNEGAVVEGYLNAKIELSPQRELHGQDDNTAHTYQALHIALEDSAIGEDDEVAPRVVVEDETEIIYTVCQGTLGRITIQAVENPDEPDTLMWQPSFEPCTLKFDIKSFGDSINFIDGNKVL